MKKLLILSAAALGLAMGSCSDDAKYDLGNGSGEGRVMLRTTLNAEVTKSRAMYETTDELNANAMIWISNEKGLVRRYNGVAEVPSSGITLLAGKYTAEVWAGDSVPASFSDRYFKGSETFTVGDGSITQVNLVGRLANVVASVTVEDGAKDVLTDITMTVGHKTGTLEYGQEAIESNTKGYFMMPSIDKNLTWTLKGIAATGEEYTKTGTIENAQPKTEYVLTIRHNGGVSAEVGAAFITVEVVEKPVEEVEDEFNIMAAPSISGIGYEINNPVVGEPEQFTKKSVWIAATSFLKQVEVRCDAFTELLGIGGNDFEIFGMQPEVETAIHTNGINWTYTTHDDTQFSEMKITFEKELLNRLPNGEYPIFIAATDNAGKVSNATLNITVSGALLRTDLLPSNSAAVWATKATVSASIMKDGITGAGIQYRQEGSMQWNQVAYDKADLTAGAKMVMELTGLEPATTYEYQAYCDEFVSDKIGTFTTEAALQLPNAGFEEWSSVKENNKDVVIPTASANDLFWDTGNHGSATMSKMVTDKNSEFKHSGNYSACLKSQFVGVAMFGKFAAGNIFIGKYLETEGTNGVLGWGRCFASRPRALRAWVKYSPVAVTDVAKNYPGNLKKGDTDNGIIYLAILDGNNKKDNSYGTTWPCVIRTAGDGQFFSKNDQNVIAYGEKIFTNATGDKLIEVEIPLEYFKTDVKAVNILCVASASVGGDYFTGGSGSEMIIDDFELLY